MRPWGISAVLAVLSLLTVQAEGINLVTNGGFEDSDAAGRPVGWVQWPATLSTGASVTVDSNIARTGTNALRISHTRQNSYSRADQIVSVTPGRRYMISCWIRGQDLQPASHAGGARLFVGRNGTGDSFRSLGPGRDCHGTFPWTRYEIGPVDVGSQTRLAFLPYLHQTSGTVWYDDIEIVEVTPDLAHRIAQSRVRAILLNDLALVEEACRDLADENAVERALMLRETISGNDSLPTDLDRRRGPPFFPLHTDLCRILGKALAARFPKTPLLIWSGDPFARQCHLAVPPEEYPRIALTALRGDVEQAVINLTNAGTDSIDVRLALGDSLDGLDVTWREVIPVELRDGRFIDDALPRAAMQGAEALVTVPAGITRQVWLEIRAGNAPGMRSGFVNVRWNGGDGQALLSIRVLNRAFPEELPLKTFCYAYLPNRGMTGNRIAVAAADLEAHRINAMMPHYHTQGVPDPVYGTEGETLDSSRMDWSSFDRMLAYATYVDTFVFLIPPRKLRTMFAAADREPPEFGGDEWEKRACEWVRAVLLGLRDRGIGYDRMLWTSVDEPSGSHIDVARVAGRMFQKTDPNLRVYNNFYRSATPADIKRLDETTDVWAPHLDCLDEVYLPICAGPGRELWAYRVQGKGTDPASVRGAFWRLFRLGVTGYSFWTYVDASDDPWTPYDVDRHDYHVVYSGDPDEMIPSKRWEAWREGVEDYMLLSMLAGNRQGPVVPVEDGGEPVAEASSAEYISRRRAHILRALSLPR